jgi:hypothetical protein
MYTACPLSGATAESNITMLTSGRTAILSECLACGSETQKNSR